MGCDIHLHVEIFRNGKWKNADRYSKKRDEYYFESLYSDRNYSLFASLANVRNYGNTEYICEPRGIPSDTNTDIKDDYESWSSDAHSASHFTLRELIDAQERMRYITYRGMISPEAQSLFDEKGIIPLEWCQYTNAAGWAWRTWKSEKDVFLPLINKLKERAFDEYLAYDEKTLIEKADRMRIVFWFDN